MKLHVGSSFLFLFLVGCTIFPSATDLTIQGHIQTNSGQPISGATVRFTDLKYRVFSMPGVGEHGTVKTDKNGNYLIRLAKAHDAIDLRVSGHACPHPHSLDSWYALIPKDKLVSRGILRHDFISCLKAANNSFKPNPLRGSA